jgi:hypothetical protein
LAQPWTVAGRGALTHSGDPDLAAVMAFAAASTAPPGPQLFVFDDEDDPPPT